MCFFSNFLMCKLVTFLKIFKVGGGGGTYVQHFSIFNIVQNLNLELKHYIVF
jgi:hypothetical protein